LFGGLGEGGFGSGTLSLASLGSERDALSGIEYPVPVFEMVAASIFGMLIPGIIILGIGKRNEPWLTFPEAKSFGGFSHLNTLENARVCGPLRGGGDVLYCDEGLLLVFPDGGAKRGGGITSPESFADGNRSLSDVVPMNQDRKNRPIMFLEKGLCLSIWRGSHG
jgi:hypothetical protein